MKTLFLFLLFSLQAHAKPVANFTGHWVATSGKVSSQLPGLSGKCSHVEIIIEQSETQITTKIYKANCNLFSSEWGPIVQEIRDGKIYEGSDEIGTIDETKMLSIFTSGGVQYAYNLRLGSDGQAPYLDSYYGVRGSVGAIVVEARMQKVQP